jgi:predicted Ser/Thr protein kinase
MDCPACHAALPDDARFCAHCGTPVSRTAADVPDPLRDILKVALGRQYEITRLLGRGGMGAVYLAVEQSLDREVAIKVLPPQQHATSESRERFRREARTAAKLSHPNIVPLHTFGDVDGTLFFVMGYVKGESLASMLRREGRLDSDRARRILIDIANALEYAHSLGIVHRDIKPDNVLIEEGSGRAVLTDFGVAKPLGAGETLTLEGSLLGTPHYMSPEQAAGKSDIDHRSDLYSLGVMGYAMLSGRLPFEGKSTQELLMQHLTVEATPLHVFAPSVAPELSIALTRCLAKDVSRRWFSAADFRAQLDPPGEDDVPQAVLDMREFAAAMLVMPLVALYVLAWFAFSGTVPDEMYVIFALGGIAYVSMVAGGLWKWRSLSKSGYDNRRIAHEMFRQPKRWIGWYPRVLRVKGDVWDRLPAQLRRARTALSIFITMTFLVVVPFWICIMANINRPDSQRTNFPKWVFLPMLFAIAPLIAGFFFQFRWRRALHASGLLDEDTEAKMLTTSTLPSPFWTKPSIVRLLERETAAPVATPSTPSDLLQAIRLLAAGLSGPAKSAAARAVSAAEAATASIEALDDEIATLMRTSDPTERARLSMKLEAVGSGDETARLEIRELLQQQLALVSALDGKLAGASGARTARTAQLSALHHQVAALATGDTTHAASLAAGVNALCDEIHQGLSASTDAETIVR